MRKFSSTLTSGLAAGAVALALTLTGGSAHAAGIIKNPGDHPDYSVELEPHGILAWSHRWWGDTGLGLGMHAVIPFLDNGPISTINNNMGIGFGLDWAHYSASGCGFYNRFYYAYAGCDASGDSFMFPVFLQWNFFFTKVISVYGEAGLFIAHDTISLDPCVNAPGYSCSASDTNVYPWFTGGARFLFGDTVGLNVRIGYPMMTVGVSILL